MRTITRYGAGAVLAVALAGGGFATGQASTAPAQPKIPTSCIAPLEGTGFKIVPDGDAERYTDGVYVCVQGMWVLDPDYGQ